MDSSSVSSRSSIESAVLVHVAELVGREVAPSEPIISSGLVESITAVLLIAFLEEQFGIEVPDEEIVFENFDSVDAIVALVDRLQADAG